MTNAKPRAAVETTRMFVTPVPVSLLELNFEFQIALLVGEVREVETKVFAASVADDLGRPGRRQHHGH